MKVIKIIGLVLIITIVIGGFAFYRQFKRQGYCEKQVTQMIQQNPHTNWNKQVPASQYGFINEVKTIPLSLAEETKCEHEQKVFFIF